MSGRVMDDGLSEVIGFILIIAIIVIIMSLYMTYVVPTQGRENEIEHMQDVESFFINQKMNMDSLWFNNQIGIPFNQNLQLGTGGQKTAGTFSVFGIMQPIAATGTASVNNNTNATLTINGIWKGGTLTSPALLGATQVNEPNTPFFINYDTGSSPTNPYQLLLQSTKGDWSALLQVQKNEYITAKNISFDIDEISKAVTNLKIDENSELFVTLTITKNDIITLDNLVINSDINRISDIVTVNLLDEAYGLNADINFPFAITYQYYDSTGPISITSPFVAEGFSDETYKSSEIPLGGLVYESSNNYWLNQKYSYQLGGIFLEQNNIILPKINPWIRFKESFGVDYGSGPTSIVDISLDLMSVTQGMSSITGADSVQVSSKILGINNSISATPYSSPDSASTNRQLSKFRPNARYLRIEINHPPDNNLAVSWKQSFEKIFRDSYVPSTYYDISLKEDTPGSGSYTGVVIDFWGVHEDSAVDSTAGPLDLFIDYSQIRTEMSVSSTLNI